MSDWEGFGVSINTDMGVKVASNVSKYCQFERRRRNNACENNNTLMLLRNNVNCITQTQLSELQL